MIPKIIHYCWFGRNPLPKLAKKCIKSWKKYCPGYEIIQWNEDNFDIASAPLYVRQAYEAKKWAFVTDYVRLHVVYEHGGIYLDTDVELRKKLEPLLKYEAYFGFEDGAHIATGLGFGAVQGSPILAEMMADYADIPFVRADGSYDLTACPVRNTQVLLRHGLLQNDRKQTLNGSILILPSIYLCPIDYQTNIRRFSHTTVSIHWFSASWYSPEMRKRHKTQIKEMRKLRIASHIHFIVHLPNLLALTLLGEDKYTTIKSKIRRG